MLRPQPTPISAILQLYQKPNQPPLVIEKLDDIDIKTQLQCLDPDKCNTANKRNEIIRQFNNTDLQQNAFKRIRFKSILSEYHKHWYQIRDTHFKMVEHWNERDFSLNVIVHFIKHHEDGKLGTEDKELKRLVTTWRFLDYLGQFFDKKGFNGQEFISKHVPNNQDPQAKMKSSGFGLTIVKEVCKQFDQKTGQYTKVKKQLSAWAKNNVERYQAECAFSMDDIKENTRNHTRSNHGISKPNDSINNDLNMSDNDGVQTHVMDTAHGPSDDANNYNTDAMLHHNTSKSDHNDFIHGHVIDTPHTPNHNNNNARTSHVDIHVIHRHVMDTPHGPIQNNNEKTRKYIDAESLKIWQQLMTMGFEENISLDAVKRNGTNVEGCINYILEQNNNKPQITREETKTNEKQTYKERIDGVLRVVEPQQDRGQLKKRDIYGVVEQEYALKSVVLRTNKNGITGFIEDC
eukprot:195935_1